MYRNVLHKPNDRFYRLSCKRMVRHYSTKDFFLQMPNALLARYFEGREAFGDLDLAAMRVARPDELFVARRYSSDGKQNAMDATRIAPCAS